MLELVPLADLIVVAVKVGRSEIEAAERTIAILRDLTTAPLLLVITGMKQERRHYYYDYSERVARPDDKSRRKGRSQAPAQPSAGCQADPSPDCSC